MLLYDALSIGTKNYMDLATEILKRDGNLTDPPASAGLPGSGAMRAGGNYGTRSTVGPVPPLSGAARAEGPVGSLPEQGASGAETPPVPTGPGETGRAHQGLTPPPEEGERVGKGTRCAPLRSRDRGGTA